MTDTTNNNNVPHDQTTSTNGHLQDKLVKDSIAHNQNISAQAQARQSALPTKAAETVKKTALTHSIPMILPKYKIYQLERHKANKPLCQTIIQIMIV